MGEIIDKPIPSQALRFTGERLTSDHAGQTAVEHWHRYLLARELTRGRDVLDLACGEGYGSALIAQTARNVVGVDISPEAIEHAQANYRNENLRYVAGEGLNVPLPDASVDAVVSFETLEHLLEQDRFLQEIRRVLRPDGFLLISTPDRDVYSPASSQPNPYHKLELTTAEFLTLLRRHFPFVRHQGQRPLLGSALLGSEQPKGAALCFDRRGGSHFEASTGMARARYVVALASECPSCDLPDSIYVDTDQLGDFDGLKLEKYDAEASSMNTMKLRVDELEVALARADEQLASAGKENEDLRARLQKALDEITLLCWDKQQREQAQDASQPEPPKKPGGRLRAVVKLLREG